ncbi:ectodysplasin-A receptor-associated adapter protein isoform X2 [Denticeps clupeoides]|uniref:ectodysplasin-A receptor-associated adapter protein isoform X2 n=1 Tax=Denticeps clupeoides TaxID=299321 RepID=UPI0010A3FDF4|nr:ectodysplasin-A receptor-associated adapter protein isoform X2 [Denticeps clupeoides]
MDLALKGLWSNVSNGWGGDRGENGRFQKIRSRERIISEPVEDTDTSSFAANTSLKSNYPVQVTDTQVTLQFRSMSPRHPQNSQDRIQQPVENDVSEYICPPSIPSDFTKGLQNLDIRYEKCCCPPPPPMISDLMNDRDLLQRLQQKLDPTHCTVKNWKNFASRWGMSYDELTLLEHRTQGSAYHSPTHEFLLRNSQKSVRALAELCRLYQRIDVLQLLQRWMENDWPSRCQQAC